MNRAQFLREAEAASQQAYVPGARYRFKNEYHAPGGGTYRRGPEVPPDVLAEMRASRNWPALLRNTIEPIFEPPPAPVLEPPPATSRNPRGSGINRARRRASQLRHVRAKRAAARAAKAAAKPATPAPEPAPIDAPSGTSTTTPEGSNT